MKELICNKGEIITLFSKRKRKLKEKEVGTLKFFKY